MPSRLKLGVRADLSEVGDFSECTPLLEATSWGEGISIVKSRLGRGKCLTTLALVAPAMAKVPAECGESPLEDGDMLLCAIPPDLCSHTHLRPPRVCVWCSGR